MQNFIQDTRLKLILKATGIYFILQLFIRFIFICVSFKETSLSIFELLKTLGLGFCYDLSFGSS